MPPDTKSLSRKALGTRHQPQASREAILRAAAAEFAAEGRAGARMQAIARAARVNKALLYYYFEDKDALYGAVLDQYLQPLFQQLTAVLDGPASPGDRILSYARVHFNAIAESPQYARLFQGEMMSAGRGMSAHLSRIVEDFSRPLSLRLVATLNEGIRCGAFRGIDPAQFIPSMLGTIVFYFAAAPVMHRLRGEDPLSSAAIAARRAAVLDQIAAALFADRETGLRLAVRISAPNRSTASSLLPSATRPHRIAARRRK